MEKTDIIKKKPSSFAVRTASGSVFVALIVAFFLLRQYVNVHFFSILIWFFCAVGTFEVARAIKAYTSKSIFVTHIVFGIAVIPFFYLIRLLLNDKTAILITLDLTVAVAFLSGAIRILSTEEKQSFKSLIVCALPVFYPSVFIYSMMLSNTLFEAEIGFIALLLVFVISPLSDTFAYLVGMTYQKIRKGQAKKLCPRLSPKKTVAGAIGGIVGGVVGSILVFLIFKPTAHNLNGVWLYLVIGVLASVATEAGDLFESLIKRKVGIKDMGKIMPGHGGVMDRIDGISLCSLFVFLVFFFAVYIF